MRKWPLFLICLVLWQCKPEKDWTHLRGGVFGTYYDIAYKSQVNYQTPIDSFFIAYDKAVSKYNPKSELSQFNRNGKVRVQLSYLPELLLKAKKIHQLTSGALEPTLGPLINAWGFGTAKRKNLDSAAVDSLLHFVDFDAIIITDTLVYTEKKGVRVDLNIVGEGFAIDWLSNFFKEKGLSDFKVEIGGEVFASGRNPEDKAWTIGIENPYYDSKGGERLFTTLTIEDEAISTSGSYRHFFIDSLGNKYSHIIDPQTGYPIKHDLISVSIKAPNSTLADGLATSCMVMGREEAKVLIDSLKNVEALFLFEGKKGLESWVSAGFYD